MIQQGNIKYFQGFFYLFGNLFVLFGRLQVTGWMIMDNNNGRPQAINNMFANYTNINEGSGYSALRYFSPVF